MSVLKNIKYATFPVLAHNPFQDEDTCHLWSELLGMRAVSKFECQLPDDCTLVTWNDRSEKGLLELQLDKLMIPYHTLGKNDKWLSNRLKITSLLEFLETIKTKYILGCDCYDVIVTGNLSYLQDVLKYKNCKIFYNATIKTWPPDDKDTTLESKMCLNKPFRFFNSGLFYGEVALLKYMLKNVNINDHNHKFSDQYLLKKMYHQLYPLVQIDWQCRAFQICYSLDEPIENFVKVQRKWAHF